MKQRLFFFFYLIFVPIVLGSHPQRMRTDSDRAFRTGKYTEALSSYKSYLDTGKSMRDFSNILLKASIAEQDMAKGLNLLLFYERRIPNSVERALIFSRIGLIYEYLGNDTAAFSAYRVVFENSTLSPDYEVYLRSGFLALESGNTNYALSTAFQILQDVSDGNLRVSALVLAISTCALSGDFDLALSLIKKETDTVKFFAGPSHYYNLWRFYRAYQASDQVQNLKEFILTNYPKSPEAMILKGKIKSWISPFNVFL